MPLYRTQIESGKPVKLVWLPQKYEIGDLVKLRGSAREWFVAYQWPRGARLVGSGDCEPRSANQPVLGSERPLK
jgi:hypothetical protein